MSREERLNKFAAAIWRKQGDSREARVMRTPMKPLTAEAAAAKLAAMRKLKRYRNFSGDRMEKTENVGSGLSADILAEIKESSKGYINEVRWYVVHTYSGYEKKVADNIVKQAENRGWYGKLIEEVLLPTEEVETKTERFDKKTGKSVTKTKPVTLKLFPGYVYVKMLMTDETWYLCRNTRGVTGFVGPGSKPIPLTEAELKNLGVTTTRKTVDYKSGDYVQIVNGALAGNEGVVETIDAANNMAVIKIKMMGREIPAEVELSAIEYAEI